MREIKYESGNIVCPKKLEIDGSPMRRHGMPRIGRPTRRAIEIRDEKTGDRIQ